MGPQLSQCFGLAVGPNMATDASAIDALTDGSLNHNVPSVG